VTAGAYFSLQLTSRDDNSIAVNFADTGVGLSQVLPILVQFARDQSSSGASTDALNIVEQPELHLHPAAHAGLADLYLSALRASRAKFIVETHSENFVLRLRRRIAEGLDPALVSLNFIEHDGVQAQIRRMPIDPRGRVENWPAGVFSEDATEVRAINTARSSTPHGPK
jgi:predicted ATPase